LQKVSSPANLTASLDEPALEDLFFDNYFAEDKEFGKNKSNIIRETCIRANYFGFLSMESITDLVCAFLLAA
jgi:hypothetical protein